MYYMNFMERDQIKSALVNCASSHSISLSEMATEAGIAPATLTSFVNDVKSGNRDKHVLSMVTINKLTKRWPDLAAQLKIANPSSSVKIVPYIGMIDRTYGNTVGGLEPGRPSSLSVDTVSPDYVAYGVKSGHPIIKSRVYFVKPEPVYDDFHNYIHNLVVIECDEGRLVGYLMQHNSGKFSIVEIPILSNITTSNNGKLPEKISDCTNIKWLQKIEWIKP